MEAVTPLMHAASIPIQYFHNTLCAIIVEPTWASKQETLTSSSANLTTAQNLQPFLAQSPPAWNSHMPSTPQLLASYLAEAAEAHVSNQSGTEYGGQLRSSSVPSAGIASDEPTKEYVSKIGILASSMPYYHNQYIQKCKANLRTNGREAADAHELGLVSHLSLDSHPREQSTEEQAVNARRLKPHSRSTVQLQNITATAAENPEVTSQGDKKKAKSTKWQFGIRSRNQPLDAMLCIYKALAGQGAQWQVTPRTSAPRHGPGPYPVNVAGATHITSAESRLSESPEKDRQSLSHEDHQMHYEYNPELGVNGTHRDSNSNRNSAGFSSRSNDEENDDDVDPDVFPDGYIPKDPWCIHVRWRKDGMHPPAATHPISAHSSRIDLNIDEQGRRRGSIIGSLSSAAGSATSVAGSATAVPVVASVNACFVYMDVQLYMLETDCYLVDFKCAGYETIVEAAVSESERKLVGSGFRVVDKDVTSPQPFLDLTNKLVIHLARGG